MSVNCQQGSEVLIKDFSYLDLTLQYVGHPPSRLRGTNQVLYVSQLPNQGVIRTTVL